MHEIKAQSILYLRNKRNYSTYFAFNSYDSKKIEMFFFSFYAEFYMKFSFLINPGSGNAKRPNKVVVVDKIDSK